MRYAICVKWLRQGTLGWSSIAFAVVMMPPQKADAQYKVDVQKKC